MSGILDVLNRPWAIDPGKFQEVQDIYFTHLRGEKIDYRGIEARIGASARPGLAYEIVDGVAVVPINGVLLKGGGFWAWLFGGTSTIEVGRIFGEAISDDTVKGVILLIDSPGGMVDGTAILAQSIFEARGKKPIVSLASGMMASAAYWIGSAADKVFVADDTTQVGSIGVVITHVDYSKFEDRIGIKTTEITAGKYKRIASDAEPLSAEGRQYLQDMADYYYSIFTDQVVSNRGLSMPTPPQEPESRDEAAVNMFDAEMVVYGRNLYARLDQFANGRLFIGSQGIKAGLVDGVASLPAIIKEMLGGVSGGSTKKTLSKGGSAMTKQELKEKYPDLYAEILEEGKALVSGQVEAVKKESFNAGREEGASGERERARAVFNSFEGFEGYQDLKASLMFDGKTSGPEAAVQILAKEREAREKHKEGFRTDGKGLNVPPSGPSDDQAGEKDFMAIVKEYKIANKCGYSDAVRAVARLNPEAHRAYLKKINAGGEE